MGRIKRRVIETGRSARQEVRVALNDGAVLFYDLTVQPLRDLIGRVRGIVGSSLDITERKKAEEGLRQSEEQFRLIFENSQDGIFFNTPEGRLLRANPAACRLLGWSEKEMCEGGRDLLVDLSDPRFFHHFEIRQRTGSARGEFNLRRKDGTVVETEGFSAIFALSTGEQRSFSIFRETAERKRQEEEKIVLGKLESTGILAGGLAHDFNNLLGIILGNLELAEDAELSEAERNDCLDEARRTIREANKLTGQFITLATGGESVRKPVALAGLLREQAAMVLRGSRVALECSVPEGLWTVMADEGQIGQAVRNLVSNALEATPEGGRVSVTAENSESPSPSDPGRFVKIAVSDKGSGIGPEIFSKVFDPYFSTKQRGSQKGMGLGLSICRSIVQKHGGTVDISSQEGRGTTVTFYLPAMERAVEKKPPAGDSISGNGRILVMDDEENLRKMIGAVLKRLQYEVELAEDGERAVEIYRAAMEKGRPFKGVILDLTIRGGMGGQETLKRLLQIDPRVNAIVASGYSEDPVMKNHAEFGFKGALTKPFFIDELKKVLSGVVGPP